MLLQTIVRDFIFGDGASIQVTTFYAILVNVVFSLHVPIRNRHCLA
jgi:hypothetical protein